MNEGAVRLNSDVSNEQAVMKVSPRKLSLRDSGLMHLFEELDLEVRQSLIDYLDRMGLIKESGMLVIPSSRHYFYDAEDMKGIRTVITLRQLNHIREVRDFLKQIKELLPDNSNFIGCFVDNRSQNGFSDKYSNLARQASDKAEAFYKQDVQLHRLKDQQVPYEESRDEPFEGGWPGACGNDRP